MNFNLTEDQQAYCDAATAFANEAFKPNAARWDRDHEFPIQTIKQAAELGFCGLYTQEPYGGLGLPRLDASLIFERLAMGCTSTTAYLTIHNMVSWMLGRWLPAEVAGEWVPRLVSGELLGSYCLTEPGAGSDAAALKSRALRDGDDYLIEGSKVFISGAGSTDVLVVMARTGGEGAGGISAFMVPANSEGIVYGKAEEKLGWHSQPTREVAFNGVRIPANYRLGEEGEGFKFAMQALDGGRINIASCSLGTAQQALDDALAYVTERQQFGRPIGEFQSVQFRLADMATELAAARLLVRQAAAKLDENSPDKSAWCAMAKRFATDIGYQICDEALQLFGGYGYIREYPLERYLRDTRVHRILEGTNEVMRLIIARRLLATPSLNLL
ncbi:alkylation response protein AidB-like acyl-CoA dehydrogenase [Aeromonas sp. BIGb0405]|uniref:acyl-CoA dehydrogenase family protein n=1 Tax=Aeromonas sp. BIGb0405 TaxID=2940592 RepID=UPI0021693E8C|nr:acyl-CoA dehydrogenase family protein [Aeromonas sp. BIGb0405]MCS3455761.1 alkylation response protein AidB-like acyl-CoA dehydrogenase [Aeromonas sp. BIGb0405]